MSFRDFVSVASFALASLVSFSCPSDVVDRYRLTMSVSVPRVYDNAESTGCRKYQRQKMEGWLTVSYDEDSDAVGPVIGVESLVNRTHRVNGRNVVYAATVTTDAVVPRMNAIGSNRTGVFKTPTISFLLDAMPDYSLGDDGEDNSLVVVLSGHGSSRKRRFGDGRFLVPYSFSGHVAGTLGCGCRAYGHKSPTRVLGPFGPTDSSDDVAAAHGTWKAKYVSRIGSAVELR